MVDIAVSIDRMRVRKVLELMRTKNLSFDITRWISNIGMSEFKDHYATKDHCGTVGCVVGHMHLAGMIDISFLGTWGYMLGENPDHSTQTWEELCINVGLFIGDPSAYPHEPRIPIPLEDVITRLQSFVDQTIAFVTIGDTTKKSIRHMVRFVTDDKLGLKFNGQ